MACMVIQRSVVFSGSIHKPNKCYMLLDKLYCVQQNAVDHFHGLSHITQGFILFTFLSFISWLRPLKRKWILVRLKNLTTDLVSS